MSLEMFSRKIWGLKEPFISRKHFTRFHFCPVRSELGLQPFPWLWCLPISFFYFTAYFHEDCSNVITFEFSVLSVKSIWNCPVSSKVIKKGVTDVRNIMLKVFFYGKLKCKPILRNPKLFINLFKYECSIITVIYNYRPFLLLGTGWIWNHPILKSVTLYLMKFKYFPYLHFTAFCSGIFQIAAAIDKAVYHSSRQGHFEYPFTFCISNNRRNWLSTLFFCVFRVNRHPKERRPILCLCLNLRICQSQICISNMSKVERLFVLLF